MGAKWAVGPVDAQKASAKFPVALIDLATQTVSP
jgi:hypothetical protein